jgi:hypothetical protein
MLAMIVIPAAITLHAVHSPATLVPTSQNPTPYGYTWSLLLFIVPIVVIAGWFLPSEELKIPQRAFGWTLVILVPLGCLLDFVFAQWFFDYPNVGAVLGINAPALGRPVPIEEYVFISPVSLRFFFSTYGSANSGWPHTTCLIIREKPEKCAGF